MVVFQNDGSDISHENSPVPEYNMETATRIIDHSSSLDKMDAESSTTATDEFHFEHGESSYRQAGFLLKNENFGEF